MRKEVATIPARMNQPYVSRKARPAAREKENQDPRGDSLLA